MALRMRLNDRCAHSEATDPSAPIAIRYTFSCPSSWSGAVRGALKINRAQPGPAMSGVTPLAGADYAAAR